jgi:hypothetical protein
LKIKFKSPGVSSRRGVRNSWSFEASRYRITLIATDNSSVCPPFRLTRVTSARLAHEAGCTSPRPTHARSTLEAAMVATMSGGGGEVVNLPLLPDASSPPPQRRSRDCAVCPIEGESKASCLRVCRACGFNHAHRHFCATRTRTAPINLLCFVCAMYRCDRV